MFSDLAVNWFQMRFLVLFFSYELLCLHDVQKTHYQRKPLHFKSLEISHIYRFEIIELKKNWERNSPLSNFPYIFGETDSCASKIWEIKYHILAFSKYFNRFHSRVNTHGIIQPFESLSWAWNHQMLLKTMSATDLSYIQHQPPLHFGPIP